MSMAAIEAAASYLREHPEAGAATDPPAAAEIDRGLRIRVDGPFGQIVSDMPTSVGGEGSAPTPGWFLRAALACCDATVIAMRAAQVGIEPSRLVVTVESDSDDRGLLGTADVPAGPLTVRVRVELAADGVPEERLREVVAWAEQHSPVGDAFRRALEPSVEMVFG